MKSLLILSLYIIIFKNCILINNANVLLDSNVTISTISNYWTATLFLYMHVTQPLSSFSHYESGYSKFMGLLLEKNNQHYSGWIRVDWDYPNRKLTLKN